MKIPTLTLHQPWATLIALQVKKIETRSWSTGYRGLLAVHAGKRAAPWGLELCRREPLLKSMLEEAGPLPAGAILAVVRLVDCVRITPEYAGRLSDLERSLGDYKPGRFAWVLEEVRRLAVPVLINGRQGLWYWETGRMKKEFTF